jgi:hypothetical protein
MRTKNSKAPQSEARERLASLIDSKSAIVAKIESLGVAIGKLQGELTAAAPLESKLAALDSAESSAMSAWAQSGAAGGAPKSDTKARESLNKSIAVARAGANAAKDAHTALAAQHLALHHDLGNLKAPFGDAIAAILVEETAPLAEAYAIESRKLHVRKVQLTQVLDILNRFVDGPTSYVSPMFGQLVGKLQATFAEPGQDDDQASVTRAQWLALAGGLESDASLKLPAKGRKEVAAPTIDIAAIAALRLKAIAVAAKGI